MKYLSALVAVVLIGTAFTSCAEDDAETANVGLGIKTFFPTKVVTNQPMTINGSGFMDVTEIEFPGGQKVTDFEIVGNDMIRVNAPSGIDVNGGNIIVRTSSEQAESRVPLTVGHTVVTGFSKQPGEEANGGEQISVFGTDLEFINNVELLNAEGEAQLLDQKDFYRKGTSSVIFTLPKKDIFEGTWTGTLHTYDGQSIAMPELTYKPAKDEGHYEIVKTSIWKNDGSFGTVNWNGTYRFAPESNSTGEECYTVPQDVWEQMKAETFYVTIKGASPQIRVTTGWWSVNMTADDIMPGNELLVDNGDGTWTLEVTLASAPDLLDLLDAQHLLFTGGGDYTVEELYFAKEEWIDGPGGVDVQVSIWKNDGTHGNISWNGEYRFAPESNSTGEEIYTVPQDQWEKMKSGKFYLHAAINADWYNLRITTGWWSVTYTGGDIGKGDERLVVNEDGTFVLELDLTGDPILDVLDAQHLLFTGEGYTPLELYFIEKGSGGGSSEIDIAPFTLYEDRSANLSWPFYPSWSDNSGKVRIMRGLGDTPIEKLGLSTSSKFIVYKEPGTTGQIQFNNPNWVDLQAGCNDWDGSLEQIEVPITEDMLKCINGEVVDGWSDTALILQGDGLTVKKIVIVK
jgi:hypothetical protein